MPLFKNQYRVVEYSDKHEGYERRFRPEQRYRYFFWKGFVKDGCTVLKESFETVDEANKFLYHYHKHRDEITEQERKMKARKGRKAVTHEYNEVFYKLKK